MARIGLLEEEQSAPQNLRVSLEVSYDFEKIQESDEMADGIDYSDLIESVRAFCSSYDGKNPGEICPPSCHPNQKGISGGTP